MEMIVFRREFMKNLKGFLIWTASIVGLLALMLAQYKSMGSGLDSSSYTEEFRNAMGMDKVDLNTFMGYYAIKASVVVTLFGGIYAAILGSGLLVRDESLLSLPVSRESIVLERFLAATTDLVLFNAAILAVILTIDQDSRFWWIALGQFLLHMVFLSVGLLTAALKIRSKAPVVIPIGIALGTYFLTIVYGLSDKLEPVKYLSPFYYTDVKDVIVNDCLRTENLLAVCGMVLLFTAAGGLVFCRRDMPA